MSDLVGNPEDRFAQNEAHLGRSCSCSLGLPCLKIVICLFEIIVIFHCGFEGGIWDLIEWVLGHYNRILYMHGHQLNAQAFISKSMRVFMVIPMVPMVYQYRSRLYQLYHW